MQVKLDLAKAAKDLCIEKDIAALNNHARSESLRLLLAEGIQVIIQVWCYHLMSLSQSYMSIRQWADVWKLLEPWAVVSVPLDAHASRWADVLHGQEVLEGSRSKAITASYLASFFCDDLAKLLKDPDTSGCYDLAELVLTKYSEHTASGGDFSEVNDHVIDAFDDIVKFCSHLICLLRPCPGWLNSVPDDVFTLHNPQARHCSIGHSV